MGENEKKDKKKDIKKDKKPIFKGVTVRNEKFSESYDEYLEFIYRISLKNPGGWVKNKDIANRLKVKAPSVTNMLEKLSNAHLIIWKRRVGIKLTDKGKSRAKNLISYHIIIELFLGRILKLEDPVEINKIACDFEHHLTPKIREKLSDLLGIGENLTNVDNFILENKMPTHIKTQMIYSTNEYIKILKKIESRIIKDVIRNKKSTPSDKEKSIKEIFKEFS